MTMERQIRTFRDGTELLEVNGKFVIRQINWVEKSVATEHKFADRKENNKQ